MAKRFAIKIAGASGQGVNVMGEILLKSLKREGFNVFGYREYPSLIKGGHATYQIDIADEYIAAPTLQVDLLVVLNRQATDWHLTELKSNAIILHDIDNPRVNTREYRIIKEKKTKFVYVPSYRLSKESDGNDLTVNIVNLGVLWNLLGLQIESVLKVVEETFASKPKYLPIDIACLKAGYYYNEFELPTFKKRLLRPDEISQEEKTELHIQSLEQKSFNCNSNFKVSENLLLSGNEALGLGVINGGVRAYFAYPMTPSSSLLSFLAENQAETGMIVKQAEDEITAASMVVGAMHMGTRALTGTSGGGFDLMTEHISLAAMIETPFVCVLGQRPGPATGMPTWTTQGDLMLSIFSAHGEFTRCVIGIKDAEDAFYSIQEAFNIAEKYQIPVVVLTDKYIAEGIFNVKELDQNKIQIERFLVEQDDVISLTSSDRYKLTETGVSKRWLPGTQTADYDANSDEHDEEGNVTEESEMSKNMIHKRLLKEKTLLNELPEPEIYNNGIDSTQAINIIGWGSTFNVVNDIFPHFAEKNIRINYMHIKYLWPLKTESLQNFVNEQTILVEANHNGQLGQLIKMQTGIDIKHKILKWDGRPFFVDELIQSIEDLNL